MFKRISKRAGIGYQNVCSHMELVAGASMQLLHVMSKSSFISDDQNDV